MNGLTTGEYEPGGAYTFIYDIQNYIPAYDDLQKSCLQSHGYDETYPSNYCNTVAYGATLISFNVFLSYDVNAAHPVSGYGGFGEQLSGAFSPTPKEFQDAKLDLATPVIELMSASSAFTSNMVFGQPVGDSEPSKMVVETDTSAGTTSVKWYKNGVLVATDTIGKIVNGAVHIAVVGSGNAITGYAYIFNYSGEVWTSGLKSTADVLTILNTRGYAGEDNTLYGWTDAEQGDFVMSKIFNTGGQDSTTGNATSWDAGGTIAGENEELEEHCLQYGGYIGTDLIEHITGKSSGAAWTYLTTDPTTDGLTYELPSNNEHTYTLVWDFSNKYFKVYEDETFTDQAVTSTFRTNGSHIYLTWYRQSRDISDATALVVVYMVSASGNPYYTMTPLNIGTVLELEEFDNESAFKNLIEGYDPNAGQNDDPQDDPDDVEDPDYDALGSGFLYAFMVDSNDMVNLADALVPDTLAQKIRADFGNNLFEFIVSYHIMPCLTNADSLHKTNIAYRGQPFVYGENDTQLALAPITTSFYTISCGSRMCLPTGVRQNGFENWAQANIQLYLPFIGYIHLNTADVWNKKITVSYKFDILQGTCVANIGVGNNGTIYSYEGVCKYSIPFTTAIDHSNAALLSGIMSSATAAVNIGGVVAGGSPTGLLNAAGGISNAAGSFLQAAEHKSTINRGGCLSGAPGWQMPRKPALIITVPNWISPGMVYNDINGYPTYKTGLLSGWVNNYVEVGQIDLKAVQNSNGASPNDSELDMINSILKGGVYV